MNHFCSQLWILTLDELGQLLRRKRALIAFLLYILVVGLVIYGFSSVDSSITQFLEERSVHKPKGKDLLAHAGNFPGREVVAQLLDWPITFVLFQFFAALWMSELIAMVSCDVISRDRERGSLRFLFLRTTREAYFFSKFVAHFLLYAGIHCFSLGLLAIFSLLLSDELTFFGVLHPFLSYSWSLMPLLALTLALTIFASSVSRSIVGTLMIIHLLWIPLLILVTWEVIPLFSWKMIAGIVAPFGNYALMNGLGNGLLALMFLSFGFYLFRRAEV
ncbi:MAG: ABC transporter permease subunit [Bdellovibrionales bacterium]|nr:ABC transporter permease subunit [Bdellovibrionales bacterium]